MIKKSLQYYGQNVSSDFETVQSINMICNNVGERKSERDINQARDHYSADNTVRQSVRQSKSKQREKSA